MIKLALSLTEPYRVISRYDSAINLPPEPDAPMPQRLDGESDDAFKARAEAWAAPIRAWGKPLRTARETGDYSALLVPGEVPTVFVVRQISATQWRALDAAIGRIDTLAANRTDAARTAGHLLVRYAVVQLEGAPASAVFAPELDADFPALGPIQPPAFVDLFTGHERILMEIAEVIGERRYTPPN